MDHLISVGQLRQNPTEMIRAVKRGAVYTLTDRGDPVASITPHRSGPWRSSEEVTQLLAQLGPNPGWASDLEELRTEAVLTDPWAEPE